MSEVHRSPLHFVTGALGGLVALVVFWAIGLPAVFQVCWGAAVAVLIWWYFDPGAAGPHLPEVVRR